MGKIGKNKLRKYIQDCLGKSSDRGNWNEPSTS